MADENITAWSHSRWACYEECPRKAYYKFIKKLPEPQGEALARGSEIHSKIEKYLVKGGRVPPDIHKDVTPYVKELRKARVSVELQLAFDTEWRPVEWFSRAAWCRIMIDALRDPVVDEPEPYCEVIDWKTGKVKEQGEYDTQLELYGLAGLLCFPRVAKVNSKLVFTDHGVTYTGPTFTTKDADTLKKLWVKRTKAMLKDTKFSPNPGSACRWCHFKKNNGGPCDY
jgi:RecB family exonuclease